MASVLLHNPVNVEFLTEIIARDKHSPPLLDDHECMHSPESSLLTRLL